MYMPVYMYIIYIYMGYYRKNNRSPATTPNAIRVLRANLIISFSVHRPRNVSLHELGMRMSGMLYNTGPLSGSAEYQSSPRASK